MRNWVRQAGRGQRAGPSSDERIKALEQEFREQRQINEILRKASAYAMAELDHTPCATPPSFSWRGPWPTPPFQTMIAFIDDHREADGVEPICTVLGQRLDLRGTWSGFVYVPFIIDNLGRRIVGWRVSRTAHATFVLDALEQAFRERRPLQGGGLKHHSDRGSQYLALRSTARLAEAGIEPSVGSVGASYDNNRRDNRRPLQGQGDPSTRSVAIL